MADNTLTTKQVLTAHKAITDLIANDRQNKFIFSGAVRCRLAGNLRKTKPIAEDFETERANVIKTLGEEDKNKAGSWKVLPVNQTKWEEEIKTMLDEKTEVTLTPITEPELLGLTKDQIENGEGNGNQVDLELIGNLKDTGVVKE